MSYREEQEHMEKIASVLRADSPEKLMLNVKEYAFLCECWGSYEDIRIARGLLDNPKDTIRLGERLKKGSLLSKSSLIKAIKVDI